MCCQLQVGVKGSQSRVWMFSKGSGVCSPLPVELWIPGLGLGGVAAAGVSHLLLLCEREMTL